MVSALLLAEINAIPQEQIDILNAGGENLTAEDITNNIYNADFVGTEITFEAVILTDPRKSGLSNVTDGRVDRIHMFVRDTSAATLGPDGMGIQVVDGAYDTNNLLSFGVGDVIQITATVSPFGTAMQVAPTSVTSLGFYTDLGLPDEILDPIVVTTDEANSAVGADGVQVNWDNLARLRNAFVRVENVTIQTRSLANPDRPDFYVSSDAGTTVLNFYDTGLQFRNDRFGAYPMEFIVRTDDMGNEVDFEPPPPGSTVNMQGVLIFQGGADQIGRGVPANGLLSIAPFEAATDFELLESAPVVSDVMSITSVPDGSGPETITFSASVDPNRTLTDTFCSYITSDNATPENVTASDNGDGTYSCDIPAQADGVFVQFEAGATDNTDATTLSPASTYRTLTDGINEISDIQLTIDEGHGDSPFSGLSTEMDITATVQTSPASSGILAVQDDADLNGWTGIFIEPAEELPELNPGDVVQITNATIERRVQFGFNNETWLTGVTLEVMSTGGEILGYKPVNTDLLQNESVAAAHEGMLLRFDNVQITSNDTGFGQWAFATIEGDTTQASVQGDDVSVLIDGGTDMFSGNEKLEFIQGAWLFAFNTFRVLPEDSTDIGMVTNVATEDEALPNSFALHQNFPNPFNPTTTISYQISQPGQVVLEIFDTLGRRVATLVDGTQAAGPHTATFNASDLSSGLYLYRLKAGDNVSTRKMILLK